ncbi:HAD family hydrolase [Idiomarina abyssalis]|uniref:HAD family hydrolase n=1 Tax=Idiomarina abyssalis TaxID=86102 RepID=UPI001CD4C279|nr:HAD hydrolase-like protein [Idiomarina abyssalis]
MNSFNIVNYSTLIFDCDGVLLNSNNVKTEAFYRATLPYGKEKAKSFVKYHKMNGGISRYKKFQYFLDNISDCRNGPDLEGLLNSYSENVIEGLLSCEIAEGLSSLREKTLSSSWMVVSGGDQKELRCVFKKRGLDGFFDKGIFGSPATKEDILNVKLSDGEINNPAIFLGDSKYDYIASQSINADFLFVRDWSELNDADSWIAEKKLKSIGRIKDLL